MLYVNFELMYTTYHIFLVLPIKYLINEDGNPTTPHKLATRSYRVCPNDRLEYVAQGVYVTAGRIAIASEQGCDVYANALEKLSSNTTLYEDIISLVLGMYTRYLF